MSFFIGNQGYPLLHITNGHNTEAEMKGPPMTNTIFHSSLPYMRVLSIRDAVTISTGAGTLGLRIPNDTLTELVSGYSVLLLLRRQSWSSFRLYTAPYIIKETFYTSSGTYRVEVSWGYHSNPSWPSPVTNFDINTQYPSASRPYLLVQNVDVGYNYGDWNQSVSDPFVEAKFAVISIRNNNYVPSSTSPIEISNYAFSAGSVDLHNYMYIRADTINSRDTVFTVNGHAYQIVNSNKVISSTELSVSPDGNAVIKCGGEVIFTASASPRMQYRQSYTVTIPEGAINVGAGVTGNTSAVIIPDGSLAQGDLVYVTMDTVANYNATARPPSLYMYTGAGLIDLYYTPWYQVLNGNTYVAGETLTYISFNSNGGATLHLGMWAAFYPSRNGTIKVNVHKVA